jgi:hypothetical protein
MKCRSVSTRLHGATAQTTVIFTHSKFLVPVCRNCKTDINIISNAQLSAVTASAYKTTRNAFVHNCARKDTCYVISQHLNPAQHKLQICLHLEFSATIALLEQWKEEGGKRENKCNTLYAIFIFSVYREP